jgi:hypothetical protein
VSVAELFDELGLKIGIFVARKSSKRVSALYPFIEFNTIIKVLVP